MSESEDLAVVKPEGFGDAVSGNHGPALDTALAIGDAEETVLSKSVPNYSCRSSSAAASS